MTQPQTPLTYRDAGVDIDAGDALVDRIKPMAARTMREGVLAGIGGFDSGGIRGKLLDLRQQPDAVWLIG